MNTDKNITIMLRSDQEGNRYASFEDMIGTWQLPHTVETDADALHYIADQSENLADGDIDGLVDWLRGSAVKQR